MSHSILEWPHAMRAHPKLAVAFDYFLHENFTNHPQ
jgi:hypothetical protein